jgi:sulfatase modifying factor 1
MFGSGFCVQRRNFIAEEWIMKKAGMSVCLAVVCVMIIANFALADSFGTFDIDFVTISGSSNPTSGYGIVNKDYRMGTYEVTNDQWNKFKAAYGTVTGTPATAYDGYPNSPNNNVPTTNVSWYEAAQFVNYLNTSTGHTAAYKFTGEIHTNSYTLDVWGTGDADGTNNYRHKDAKYFLPTENEWVKAAYWNGTSLQTYANASPSDLISGSPDPAKWNYQPSVGNVLWNVGSGVKELNGTYDMMGNVWERMESPVFFDWVFQTEVSSLRGGAWNHPANYLALYYNGSPDEIVNPLYNGGYGVGFRVASIPEPVSLFLLSLGGLLVKKTRPHSK